MKEVVTLSEINYPEDFVQRVKAAFPDTVRLHELLDTNSPFVGRYLDDSYQGGFSPQYVLEALFGGLDHLVALRDEALRRITRRELYREWGQIMDVASSRA